MGMYIYFFVCVFAALAVTGIIERRDEKRRKKQESELARLRRAQLHRMAQDQMREARIQAVSNARMIAK